MTQEELIKAENAYNKIIDELNLDNDDLWCKLSEPLDIMDNFFRNIKEVIWDQKQLK